MSAQQEITDDLFGGSNADLNVIQFTETGAGIQFAPFQEEPARGVERLLAFPVAQEVEGFDHRAIKPADLEK